MSIIIDQRMLEVAGRLASLAEGLDSNPEIEGFHLTYISNSEIGGLEMAETPVGRVRSPYGGPSGIKGYSNEKALRAAAHRLRDPDAISSWQTSNPRIGMYQGAVIFPFHSTSSGSRNAFNVLSVSAYEEPMDEAVALILGLDIGLGDVEFARKVVETSGNTQYKPLYDSFYEAGA